MKNPRLLILPLLLCNLSYAADESAEGPTPPTPAEQLALFKLPPGFEMQLVVSDPDIGQPMNLNFDVRGRLWITHSVEYPYPARGEGVEKRSGRFAGIGEHDPRDRLTVVSGIAANGTPQKVQHFAGGLNIPIGHTPIGDGSSALVYGIPSIFHCTDRDGDGVADDTRTLYTRFGNIDVHGNASSFTRWVDGWIYGCHGFSNSSEVKDGSGNITKLKSGNTYRFRADGSHFESFTRGQTNPFGLTVDPLGNFYSSDCHSMPIYLLLPGAQYPGLGAAADTLGEAPKMIDHSHGSTGICGPAYYAATHFPEAYRDNVFICNPVTGKVHRDLLKWTGSSPMCDTQPDLITTTDKWFRPVDALVGPDGALYIADFCNLIIGHYEAPLNHKDRDRSHGRVWRLVWKGEDGKAPPPQAMPDLTTQSSAELVQLLGHPNLLLRTLVTNYLLDERMGRFEKDLQPLLQTATSGDILAHALWALERSEGLSDQALATLMRSTHPRVRVHVMRMLAERPAWNAAAIESAMLGISDSDAFVHRGAADAMGRHPQADFVPALLRAWREAEAGDTHLVHTIRMALRHHIADPELSAALLSLTLESEDKQHLLEVASATEGDGAGALLLRFAEPGQVSTELLLKAGRQISRYGDGTQISQLVDQAGEWFADDPAGELAFFVAIARGQQERGVKLPEQARLRSWLQDLVPRMLKEPDSSAPTWTYHPLPGLKASSNPFAAAHRRSTDKKPDAQFWDSMVGGEKETGLLRSQPFVLPKSFSFWMCGHNGEPSSKEQPVNHVRLLLHPSGNEIARDIPPRHDTARKYSWNLDEHAGRMVRMEIVDAHEGGAYAWIGVGRFSSPRVAPPGTDPGVRAAALFEMIGLFQLRETMPMLTYVIGDASRESSERLAALSGLEAMGAVADAEAVLTELVAQADQAPALQSRAATMLGRIDQASARQVLVQLLERAAGSLQREAATALAQSPGGVTALLQSVSNGKASPRLLTQPAVSAGIKRHGSPPEQQQIASLTLNLPPASKEIDRQIARHLDAFARTPSDLEAGHAVFTRSCSICHRIGNEGQLVGPQLDGIGQRGLARVLEDILDPNRNVDAAYRLSVYTMNDGQVISGRELRREGAVIVAVDFKGQEMHLAKDEVKAHEQSGFSLMPPSLAASLPEEELRDLLGWLLEK